MERRKVRRRDADLFVEDETELFRDALRAGQTQKVKEMLAEVAEPWRKLGKPGTQLEKKPAILCKCAYE